MVVCPDFTLFTPKLIILLSFLTSSTVHCFGSETTEGHDNWCYRDPTCGENNWPKECNVSKSQISPIDFKISDFSAYNSEYNGYIDPEEFNFFNFKLDFKGHTLQVIPQMADFAKLVISSVEYSFHSMHFHWSGLDDAGSEHTIEGRSFPMELHLVFFDSKYSNLGDSIAANDENPTSMAVIAVFLEIEPTSQNSSLSSPCLKEIVEALGEGDMKGTQLNIKDVIPTPTTGMYEYSGTSTSPPCNLQAKWYVCRKPVFVPREHVVKIREAGVSSMSTTENFRSLKSPVENLTVGFVYFGKKKGNQAY